MNNQKQILLLINLLFHQFDGTSPKQVQSDILWKASPHVFGRKLTFLFNVFIVFLILLFGENKQGGFF